MGYDKERELIKALYPYQRWYDKVNKMSDAQIIALYMRFKAQGKLR